MIFVCGPICSGKNTYGKLLASDRWWAFVDISDIVRELTDSSKRVHDVTLDQQIIDRLTLLSRQHNGHLVVAGARQLSILQAFPTSRYIWLEVLEEERFKRFLGRNAIKDQGDQDARQRFELYEQKDQELGLGQVEFWIKGQELKNSMQAEVWVEGNKDNI